MATPALPEKICATCGRRMVFRKRWARSWDEVRHCSEACRKHRTKDIDAELEEAILALLAQRKPTATICPSEAARAVGGKEFQALMEPVRRAARRLVARGEIEITQHGHVVDPSTARGPIRLRRTA